MQRIFTTHRISRMLRCDRKAVCTWIDQGLMAGYRTPGGHRRVMESDLLAFLRERRMPLPDDLKQPRTRILIAEDEEGMITVLREALGQREQRFDLRTAPDGIGTLIEIGRFRPHIVLLDITMPDLNGVAVCKKIKADPLSRHTQVIAIGGPGEVGMRRKILACGAVAFFTKPFDLGALVDQIHQLAIYQMTETRQTRPLSRGVRG
ncbi:hypothetical protein AMJ82_07060 [candidate division TA06 bacterium SM23_40]|jgi:excisionase family DNA binding protein|uniref:Response regulatory domain-containing protein n=1 Tax=candidate division TA06 bacterium SM23_40 TaxID=1703774 RepID=A0A0S8GB62_UNCT6|nr:MAG: hypothetical protein AMJ82_07060 [candidate division TA06 bacterium SM23_40]